MKIGSSLPDTPTYRQAARAQPDYVGDGEFRFLPDDDTTPRFTVTIDAASIDGAVVCTRLTVEPGTWPITSRTLGEIDPRWLAMRLLSDAGAVPMDGIPGAYVPDAVAAWDAGEPLETPQGHANAAEVAAAYRLGAPPMSSSRVSRRHEQGRASWRSTAETVAVLGGVAPGVRPRSDSLPVRRGLITVWCSLTSWGSPPHPETVTRWWREAVARAGLPAIRLHDARHTAATVMLRPSASR